jgi:hypothetical protein
MRLSCCCSQLALNHFSLIPRTCSSQESRCGCSRQHWLIVLLIVLSLQFPQSPNQLEPPILHILEYTLHQNPRGSVSTQ